jgi:tetratricopeptide (TPR) repeat protein
MSSKRKGVVFVKFAGPNRGREGEMFTSGKDAKDEYKSVTVPDILGMFETAASGKTMSATFTRAEVARLFNFTDSRLKYWDKSGFISPSGYDGKKRCYTFTDLISIRSAKALLENGVSIQKTRRIVEQLSEKLPQSTHPLGRLRIRGDAKNVIVSENDHEYEADSGQLIIDFSVKTIEDDIISRLPEREPAKKELTAYEWYLEGCSLDEDEHSLDLAEQAYYSAIHLDPSMANAYTNLGNLRYRQGATEDAKALYTKAIEVDDTQPEPHYNLGFLLFEEALFERARDLFLKAVDLDPEFADGWFNLAMTSIRLNEDKSAFDYFRRYLALEPSGPWAEIARNHLKEL